MPTSEDYCPTCGGFLDADFLCSKCDLWDTKGKTKWMGKPRPPRDPEYLEKKHKKKRRRVREEF